MSSDENFATGGEGRKRPGALKVGPRKRPYANGSVLTAPTDKRRSSGADPLVHHGRHFGRTVHALCSVHALLNNGILRMGELEHHHEDEFTHEYAVSLYQCICFIRSCRERREHHIFESLLQMVPGLEARLLNNTDEEIGHVADLASLVLFSMASDTHTGQRFREAFLGQDLMIQKV
jgi:hypothetical protein